MNTFEEQLKRAIKEITPTPLERDRLRTKIVSEMAQTSLPVAARRMYARSRTRQRIKKTMPIALLIALLMSGSVSYAAEGTTPGDTLYPIKVHVNEQVRSALALGDVAKAKLEVDLANRRLVEAEKLQSEQRLDATTSLELKADFNEHRARAGEHIKNLESSHDEDAAAISLDLNTHISEHHDVLSSLGINEDDDDYPGEGDDNGGDKQQRDNESHVVAATTSLDATQRVNIKKEHTNKDDDARKEKRGNEGKDHTSISGGATTTQSPQRGDARKREGDDEDGGDSHDPIVPILASSTLPMVSPTPSLTPTTSGNANTFTLAQIATHNTQSSCYTAISGKAYDITSFIGEHPRR